MQSDGILKVRQENYMKESNFDIIKKREKFSFELRKNKLQNTMMEKRYNSLKIIFEDNEKFAINVSNLLIENDLVDMFLSSDNKIQMALRFIKDNDNTNVRQFGIRQVRNYSDTIKQKSSIDKNIELTNFQDIVTIMLNSNDFKEIFETTWVVINLSNCYTEYTNFLSKPNFIKQIYTRMIQIEEIQIRNHLLWIINNIMGESHQTHTQVISLTNIVDFVFNSIMSPSTPEFYKLTCIWSVSNFFKFPINVSQDLLLPIVGEISRYIQSNINETIFSQALMTISHIVRSSSEENIDKILDFDFLGSLIPHINSNSNKDDLEQIFFLIGYFSFHSDIFIQNLFQSKSIEAIEFYMSEILLNTANNPNLINKNPKLIKNICWSLCNLCAVGINRLSSFLINKTKIPKYLLELNSLTSNKEILIEILTFFSTACDNPNTSVKAEILRLTILELYCERLTDDNVEIQKLCLEGITKILKIGESVMKDRNIVKLELERLSINALIDNLQNSKDDKVADASAILINTYFSSNE